MVGRERNMTILDILSRLNDGNNLMNKSLEIIKDNYTNLVNDNYQLTINEKGELSVKIPSLEKRDEYVYKSAAEYPYPLVMCMKVPETNNVDKYNRLLSRFMDLFKDKLELFFKDVNTIEKLKENIVKTKERIDYITYASITTGAIGVILLCIFNLSETVNHVLITGIILFFIIALLMQITKESQVKKVVDAYIGLVKTEWYQKELNKEYSYLCNFVE
jgi:hypothetical protein